MQLHLLLTRPTRECFAQATAASTKDACDNLTARPSFDDLALLHCRPH